MRTGSSLPQRLQDIAPFAAMGGIADELGLTLTLRGGAASRAAMYAFHRPDHDLDLFDLVPFSSDIDLEHSGDEDISMRLAAVIEAKVSFAGWVRWAINDADTARLGAAQRQVSSRVPLRQIAFSTHAPPEFPDAAVRDLEQLTVTAERHPEFGKGAPGGRDLEIFGLMMALNVQAEMAEIVGREVRVAPEPEAWIRAADADFEEIARRPRFAARFWRLFAMRLARTGQDDPLTAHLLAKARDYHLLDHFGAGGVDPLAPALSVSGWASGDRFRVPELTPHLLTGRDAQGAALNILSEFHHLTDPDGAPLEALPIDPAFELIAVVPELTVTPQVFKIEPDPFQSGVDQEFLEIAWRRDPAVALNPLGITAQLVPLTLSGVAAEPLPAVGGVFGDYAWVRARIGNLVDMGAKERGDVRAALFILQARP